MLPRSAFDVSSTHGGMLIGTFLACAIWGASSFQTFLYFVNVNKDSVFLRCLVGILWVLDTANQVTLVKGSWRSLISRRLTPEDALAPMPEYWHHAWIAALVYCAVQLYFVRRIYLFAKCLVYWSLNSILLNVISGALVILAVWQIIAVVVYDAYGYRKSLEVLVSPTETALNLSIRVAAVTVDVVVAVCMLLLLTQQVPQCNKSRKIVHRLLIITVSSGSLTAVLSIIALIIAAADNATFYWCIAGFPLCSVYLSTLLANLNTRDYIRGDHEVITTPNIELGGRADTQSSKIGAVGQPTSS